MPGERDLTKLLQEMTPSVHLEVFVFCSFPNPQLPSTLTPIATFLEVEGLTAIVPLSQAQALGIEHQVASRMLTLTVHSALDATEFDEGCVSPGASSVAPSPGGAVQGH